MTETVDERQRLWAELIKGANGYGHHLQLLRRAADQIEQDGKRLAALASPSEGNKKGDEHTVSDTGGGFYRVLNPQGDAVGTFISREHADEYAQRCTARLASRPQEQPRTATEEMIEAGLCEYAATEHLSSHREQVERVLNAALALSVSPAAAQGWQSAPIEPTEAMLRAATMIAPTWDDAVSRAKYAAMLAAAPPSPAAQEQEKGEQT